MPDRLRALDPLDQSLHPEARELGYSGWLVVEQDIIPEPDTPVDQAAREQRANREYLRARGI